MADYNILVFILIRIGNSCLMFHNFLFFVKNKVAVKNLYELSWVIITNIVTIIFGFGIIKLLSALGTEQYGLYTLILTIVALLSMLAMGPFTQGFIRFYYHYLEKGILNTYIKYMYRSLFRISIVYIIITFLFIVIIRFIPDRPGTPFLILSTMFILFIKLDEFLSSHLNTIRKRKENSIFQIVEKTTILLILLLLYYKHSLTLNTALAVFATVYFIFFIFKILFIRKYNETLFKGYHQTDNLKEMNLEIRRFLIAYIAPFLIWGISGWLQQNSEKWIIANFISVSDLGIYAVMIALVNAFIVMPNNIIAEYITPIIFQRFSDLKNNEMVKEGLRLINYIIMGISLLTLSSIIITYFLGSYLIIIISSAAYVSYANMLPLFSLGIGLLFIGQAACFVGMSLNLPQKYLTPKISSGLLSIVFNIFFVKLYGIYGIALSVILTGCIYLIQIIFVNKKIIKQIKPELSEDNSK